MFATGTADSCDGVTGCGVAGSCAAGCVQPAPRIAAITITIINIREIADIGETSDMIYIG
jgi:hypothetical protein